MIDKKYVVDEIKSRIDIVSLISDYINVEQKGNTTKALCPFHNEKSPSFYINSQKKIYKCFGCGEAGDIFSFFMKMENVDFVEAIKILGERCGVKVDSNMSEQDKLNLKKRNLNIEINTEAARFFLSNLLTTKNIAYDYLIKRGLDVKTIKKFGLGFAPNSWDNLKQFLLNKGYKKEDLIESGLFNKKEDNFYDKFRNRVMFPIFDYRQNVIGFGGRVLDEAVPKYLNSPETLVFNKSRNLYGINFAIKNIKDESILLVEGYMDLISVSQYGVGNVVASLGTSLTKDQANLIKKYAKNVIISYDNDSAGVTATLRAIEILTDIDVKVYVLDLKDLKDPDDFIRKYGIDEFKNQIKKASHYIKYKIDNLYKNFDVENDIQRNNFIKEAIKIIKSIKSHVEIDYYSSYLSKLINVNVESIKREIYPNNNKNTSYNKNTYNKTYKNSNNKNYKPKEVIEKVDLVKSNLLVEKILIKILTLNPKIYKNPHLNISIDDFLLKSSKEIVKYIIKNEEVDKITIDKMESLNIDEVYVNDIKNIQLDAINLENVKYINEIIRNTKKNTLNEKINYLKNKQQKIQEKTNKEEVDKENMVIGLEIINITKQLKNL